jgi:hypothetical protein
VFRLLLRQTEGVIGSILQLLGLDLSVPNFSTLSRRAQSLELPAQPRATGGAIHLGSRQELCVAVRHRRTNRQLDTGIPDLPWDPIIGSRRETPDGRRRQSAAISRSVASY